MSSTRTFDQNIIRAKLDLNPILRVVDKVMGSQSETLAIHIKITYLNKELWNIFQYRPQWAQLCQHVWASRNISVHFQMKHLASFLSLTTRETRNKTERNLTDLVSGSPTTLYNKHQTAQLKRLWTADCGLRTVDSGFRSTPPWKKLFCPYSNS